MKQTSAESKRPAQSASKRLVLITLAALALIVAVFVIVQMQENRAKQPTRFSELPSLESQPVLGIESAPVTLVEFGDYKCPSCKAWDEYIFPLLANDYILEGKIKLAYVHAPFHGEESRLASLAAEAVFAQDAQSYWAYHQALFEAQPQTEHDSLWITREKLLELAASRIPQIDLARFEQDLDKQTYQSALDTDIAMVETYKVRQTPTILINGIVVDDPFDYDAIQALIEQELKEDRP